MSHRMTVNGGVFASLGVGIIGAVVAAALLGEAVLPIALVGFTAASAAGFYLLN
ncbi:MAG: hypothetical protein JRN46_03390 [Nitrososphaerota archaeon]|nr:hypothetical protein [Nitrososphaerota archaeon]